ncbi:5,6-dimethylbenzimidazole synthase [Algiphilus sp.]|uniref:5,6-dimethylbenzimidazole synthase n=1 Tax=Algiphilus sp. TaxID=1872431 RepID=UPI003B51F8AA
MTTFSTAEREVLHRVLRARRDMRHFLPEPVAPEALRRILEAAHSAPSVGYMQPWRFIRITDMRLRAELHDHVAEEQRRTAEACGARAAEVQRLKLEGLRDCSELIAVTLCDGRERYVLGRRTMPEMDLCSAACAIQNMWLAARAENLGMGWVSLFDPDVVGELLQMPRDARTIALLCLGPVPAFYTEPMLERAGWDCRRSLDTLISENHWPQEGAA